MDKPKISRKKKRFFLKTDRWLKSEAEEKAKDAERKKKERALLKAEKEAKKKEEAQRRKNVPSEVDEEAERKAKRAEYMKNYNKNYYARRKVGKPVKARAEATKAKKSQRKREEDVLDVIETDQAVSSPLAVENESTQGDNDNDKSNQVCSESGGSAVDSQEGTNASNSKDSDRNTDINEVMDVMNADELDLAIIPHFQHAYHGQSDRTSQQSNINLMLNMQFNHADLSSIDNSTNLLYILSSVNNSSTFHGPAHFDCSENNITSNMITKNSNQSRSTFIQAEKSVIAAHCYNKDIGEVSVDYNR